MVVIILRHGRGLYWILLLFPFFVCAQNPSPPNCATIPSDTGIQRLIANKRTVKKGLPERNNDITYIPMQLHLVGDSEGNLRIAEDRALNEICNLNAEFAQLDMQFYLPGEINYINDDILISHSFSGGLSGAVTSRLISNKVPNAVNLFVVDQIDFNFAGYYTIQADVVVMDRSYMDSTNSIIAHELGHFFSLVHTFSGWEEPPEEGVPVPPFNGNIPVEYVDRTVNCDMAGDFFCDTPADYTNYVWQVPGCNFTLNYLDPDSMLVDPDETNHMSYFYFAGCDDYQFSPEQSDVIIADYHSRTDLSSLPQPDLVDLNGVATLNDPIDGMLVEPFDLIDLYWEVVPGATGYYIEIFVSVGNFELILERVISYETTVVITTLDPNKNYKWRVWAFNATEFCHNNWSEAGAFETGGIASNAKEENIFGSFTISPNPVQDQHLQVAIQTKSADEIYMEILSSEGTVLPLSRYFRVAAGQQTYSLDVSTLSNGVYFLVFRSGGQVTAEKFLLQK